MSLGDYVRLVKAYIDVFGLAHAPAPKVEDEGKESSNLREEDEKIVQLCADLKVLRIKLPYSLLNRSLGRFTRINSRV
jgi:hypothetical protein